MDPGHRDRIAFLRLCSGRYERGMRLFHVRLGKEVRIGDALTFMAADRTQAQDAFAGDILGLHNHGTINIGDTFTEGELLSFTGIPNFAPEMFRRAVLRDPLRMKALQKGLSQLCEEGATQLFKPLRNNDLILGAVGPLQFEVVAFRLQDEYGVECTFENVNVYTARWIECADPRKLEEFQAKAHENLALDHSGALVYLAPTRVNLRSRSSAGPTSASMKRASITPSRPERAVMSVLRRRSVVAWALYDWAQFIVRDHGDGGILPGLLQAVLERRNRSNCQHVSARDGQRHRERADRAAGAAPRRASPIAVGRA